MGPEIAVPGDIHGNLEALEVAHGVDLESGAEKISHTGGLGGYAPFVNETVANDRDLCVCRHEPPLQAEMAHQTFVWTKEPVTYIPRDYLKHLPFGIAFRQDGWKVRIFQPTPFKNNLYWYEERPEKLREGR